jgi:AcrR family transcriptional regulator
MRLTAENKSRTRERLLSAAQRLFERNGFEQATTRDISRAGGIAVGTLFNYFPSKEALGLALIDEQLQAADDELHKKRRGDESLEELLFLHIAVGLRHLRPCRTYVLAVLESTLSPLFSDAARGEAEALRLRQLETTREIIARHRTLENGEPSIVSMHLYWTLYLGVLAFWAKDPSPNQEDTLVLLDQSTRLYVASLSAAAAHAASEPASRSTWRTGPGPTEPEADEVEDSHGTRT